MRVIVSSTGNSRPSACSAVISTRLPSSFPVPRASPARWRSRSAGGTSASPSSRPISVSGRWPKIASTAALTSTIRPAAVDRDHGVERRVEHRALARLALADGGLRAAVLDELTGEPAEAGERRHQLLVGLVDGGRRGTPSRRRCRQRDRERRRAGRPRRHRCGAGSWRPRPRRGSTPARPLACTRPGSPSPGASTSVREVIAKRSSAAPPEVQVATQCSTPPPTGSHTPPYCHPSPSPTAASRLGNASWALGAASSASATACSTRSRRDALGGGEASMAVAQTL